jgi:hypothetical protein
MFERLDLLSSKPIDTALDILYEEFDEALFAGQFEEVDTYLRHALVRRYRSATLVGFLVITLAWKPSLKERAGFYDRVWAYLEELHPDRVENILKGLK